MTSSLKLSDREWKAFKIGDVFDVVGTITTHPNKLIVGGKTPRITTAATNNALDDFYKNEPTEDGHVITIDSATVGYVSYQVKPFLSTDHVEKLTLKCGLPISQELGLFLVTAIQSATQNKYGYGYKFSQFRIKRQSVLLPIVPQSATTSTPEPDWQFMEQYIDSLSLSKVKNSVKLPQKHEITDTRGFADVEWGEFMLKDLFEIKSGKDAILKDNYGANPYLNSAGISNGITQFVEKGIISDRNIISIARTGTVGATFYHSYKSYISGNIRYLKNNYLTLNQYIASFVICELKNVFLGRFDYGKILGTARLNAIKIKLPKTTNNTPDWQFMEQYMKRMENKVIDRCKRKDKVI